MRTHQWKEKLFEANGTLHGINCSIQHWECMWCHAPYNHEGLPLGEQPFETVGCRGYKIAKIIRSKPLDVQKFEDDDNFQFRPAKRKARNRR